MGAHSRPFKAFGISTAHVGSVRVLRSLSKPNKALDRPEASIWPPESLEVSKRCFWSLTKPAKASGGCNDAPRIFWALMVLVRVWRSLYEPSRTSGGFINASLPYTALITVSVQHVPNFGGPQVPFFAQRKLVADGCWVQFLRRQWTGLVRLNKSCSEPSRDSAGLTKASVPCRAFMGVVRALRSYSEPSRASGCPMEASGLSRSLVGSVRSLRFLSPRLLESWWRPLASLGLWWDEYECWGLPPSPLKLLKPQMKHIEGSKVSLESAGLWWDYSECWGLASSPLN